MAFRLRRTLGLSSDRFVFIGLANDYADYCASPDEYMAQEYVGASTLWGPNEGPVLGCALRDLRSAGARPPEPSVRKMKVHPGGEPPERFGYAFLGEGRNAPDEELGKILRDRDDLPARKLPWATWDVTLDEKKDTPATSRGSSTSSRESGGAWKARTNVRRNARRQRRVRPRDDAHGSGLAEGDATAPMGGNLDRADPGRARTRRPLPHPDRRGRSPAVLGAVRGLARHFAVAVPRHRDTREMSGGAAAASRRKRNIVDPGR
jgi:hypothetical protein